MPLQKQLKVLFVRLAGFMQFVGFMQIPAVQVCPALQTLVVPHIQITVTVVVVGHCAYVQDPEVQY